MKTRYALQLATCLAALALPLAAASITTTFTGTNGFSGNMFDATIGSKSLVINAFDLNLSAGSETVSVYYKTGSYVGSETTPAAWTLLSTGTVTGLGEGSSTPFAVSPLTLAAGTTYGLYVTLTSTAPTMYYSNGSTTDSNSDLSLSLGTGLGGLFGASAVISSRIWNGTIDYTLASSTAPEPASLALFVLATPALFFAGRRRYLRK